MITVKKTTSIAAVAMSIFTAVMIVSVVSAYESTYGFSLMSISDAVTINNNAVAINETLIGNNVGLTAVNLFLLNKTYSMGPGEKLIHGLLLPLNLKALNSLGYPTHNVSIGLSVLGFLAALFFNLSRNFTLGNSVIPAPFDNFTVRNVSVGPGSSAIIQVTFNYFLPLLMHVSEIAVKSGGISVGNLSLSNLVHGFNSISSNITVPRGSNLQNFTFQAGPLQWSSPA